jgi:hypothetical protein
MPKTPSDKLFRLVHTLSGSEKRYFKLFANAKGEKDNKYIQLFDAMDQQDIFDDEALRKVVYGEQPIQSRKYSELKAYLYELILKSLQGYDEKTSVSYRLQHILQSIRVLYKRAMFDDCNDLLQKGYKLANKYEQFEVELALLDWEKQIAYAKTDIPYLDKELDRIQEAEADAITAIQNYTNYRDLFLKLLVSLRKDASLRDPDQRDRLQHMLDTPLLADLTQAKSHQAQILYYRIYAFYFYTIADFKQFYDTGGQLVKLMESKAHFLKEDVSEYISALSNLAVSCILTKNYHDLEQTLDKIKSVKPRTKDDELKIHRQYHTLYFRWCIDTGNFEKGLIALEAHLKTIDQLGRRLFETDSFFFQYFYIYFGTGNYDEALDYLNRWLNAPRSIQRQDLQSLARILNLIIHYEMGNTLLLESLLRSTYRFLNKRNRLHEFEEQVLLFIRTVIREQDRRSNRAAFMALQAQFNTLQLQQSERAMLQLFDFESWLESKISGESFAAVKQRKFVERER